MSFTIDMNMVKEAQDFLAKHIERTPLRKSRCMNGEIYLKCENLQKTGSFKIRGALNRMRYLNEKEKKKGVIAASAGNHAQGVAFSAQIYGIQSQIVMPKTAPMIKVIATQNYGAQVTQEGEIYDQAYEKALEIADQEGLVFIHPYQDQKVITGQGTIALEIFEELKDVDQIIVPVGGGGLISGIGFVANSLHPKCEVIGVVSDQAQGMKDLKDNVKTYPKANVVTIADGIAVKTPSKEMYDNFISKYVDRIESVTENEIAEAIVNLMEKDKLVVEGSGAVGVAAIMSGKVTPKSKTVIIVSGGNIDINTMFAVIETGLRHKGRLTRLSVIVSDLPGELNKMTSILAKCRANILDVMHDRVSPELSIRETRIDFLLETSSFDHAKEVESEFIKANIRVVGEHL